MYYITSEQAKSIHKITVEVSGGGITDVIHFGQLESVLQNIQNDEYYPTFIDKLTHLFYCTCQFHCFADGNKRLALSLSTQFLLLNGYLKIASRFIVDLDNNVVDLHKTPRGSYKQPNGDRTDILQDRPHFNKKQKRNDGYSHTHPLELHEDLTGNIHPKHSQDTHQPTFDEIMNIINGRAIPIY